MKRLLRKIFQSFNYDIIKYDSNPTNKFPGDFKPEHQRIINKAKPYTMTSNERLFSLIEAIKFISKNNIEGDIVECGVWKGGSMLAAAETLVSLNDTQRKLYMYDTYEGMSEPTEADKTHYNKTAKSLLASDTNREKNLVWAYSPLEQVKDTMAQTSYPPERIYYVKGKVEDTIPGTIPDKIALLRLDTDWYESTKHEMKYLFPLLQKGGILIIDDYGHWEGARKAIDEYFENMTSPPFLSRIDETARLVIKQ